MNPTKQEIEDVLSEITDPYLESDLVSAKAIRKIHIDAERLQVDVVLGFPADGYLADLAERLEHALAPLAQARKIWIQTSWKVESHLVQKGVDSLAGVTNIIAIASGKGGVGKSTTAANFALALSADGASVGLLDADIYGPSQPRMMGTQGMRPASKDNKQMEPVIAHGIQTMSIGYLIEEHTPMVWRGPMVTQALTQLLQETHWQTLDYLIIDLPPGTGDTQLTLAQRIPVSGAIIITTPQDIALLDARKGLKMFDKVKIPVLGVIENMGIHLCSNCGHAESIFSSGGGQRMATEEGVDFLGSLPLERRICADADRGIPTVTADPQGAVAVLYREISRRASARLSLQGRNRAAKFPNIVMS